MLISQSIRKAWKKCIFFIKKLKIENIDSLKIDRRVRKIVIIGQSDKRKRVWWGSRTRRNPRNLSGKNQRRIVPSYSFGALSPTPPRGARASELEQDKERDREHEQWRSEKSRVDTRVAQTGHTTACRWHGRDSNVCVSGVIADFSHSQPSTANSLLLNNRSFFNTCLFWWFH